MIQLDWQRPRGFSLDAASDFYGGFTPGVGLARSRPGELSLAFRLDQTFEAVGVVLRDRADELRVEIVGTERSDLAQAQVRRMLGLDADVEAWWQLGQREPVVGRLQAQYPGFLSAAKPSPYDAAAWGIIAPRISLPVAAKLKSAIAEQHGDRVRTRLGEHAVFPDPARLLAISSFPGLPETKLLRLQRLAEAALAGRLDAGRLRAMSLTDALADLRSLPGVGPWTASHVLLRGAALPDVITLAEPRILHGLASAYELPDASEADLLRISEAWRPFRAWVAVLLARHLRQQGGWDAPELTEERARAGRRRREALV